MSGFEFHLALLLGVSGVMFSKTAEQQQTRSKQTLFLTEIERVHLTKGEILVL